MTQGTRLQANQEWLLFDNVLSLYEPVEEPLQTATPVATPVVVSYGRYRKFKSTFATAPPVARSQGRADGQLGSTGLSDALPPVHGPRRHALRCPCLAAVLELMAIASGRHASHF